MKGLKIFNIILFSLICALQSLALYYLGTSIGTYFLKDIAGVIFTMLAFLPMFIIVEIGLLVLTIILTITTNVKVKKALQLNQFKTKFDKLCLTLPWIFIVANLILFFGFLILCNTSAVNN